MEGAPWTVYQRCGPRESGISKSTVGMALLFALRRRPWPDVAARLLEERGEGRLTAELARQWALVLMARGVPHRIRRGIFGPALQVPPRFEEQALSELRAYLLENPPESIEPPDSRTPPFTWGMLPGVLWSLGLVTILLTMTGSERVLESVYVDWHGRGGGDTGLMASGQWWRAVTALTLHADVAHLLGNVCLGGVFLLLLAQEAGLGAAWLLTLLAGTGGNLAKVALQGPGNHFLGASTGVFGALGALAGIRLLRSGHGQRWRRATPFAAALMLLAFLGVGSEEESRRIDLAGHFLGFASGCALGAALAALERVFGKNGRALSPWMGAAAAVVLFYAWGVALGF